MPFLSPNHSVKALKGKISHSMDLLTPSSPRGLLTLSLTTNSSWLPWGKFAMPLISPVMPVLRNSGQSAITKPDEKNFASVNLRYWQSIVVNKPHNSLQLADVIPMPLKMPPIHVHRVLLLQQVNHQTLKVQPIPCPLLMV